MKGKSNTSRRPLESPRWREVSGPCSQGFSIVKREPASAVAVLCRPGMVVSIMTEDGGGTAEVAAVTEEFCIVKNEHGRSFALYWHEVEVSKVVPDPAAIAKPPTA